MSPIAAASTAIEAAFKRLEQTVSDDHARDFYNTELKDVRQAALDIEKWQRSRKSLRNMARIGPLLAGIQQYAGPLETLCQGTPYLPFIWAPIKLMLQIASQYTSIFDQILDAYAKIGEALPRFDRYQKIFQQPDFKHVLALIYADILDFHRRAYKILTRRAWNLLFHSLWSDFGLRFQGILGKLKRHCDLLDREAVSFDIVESSNWRAKAQEDLESREKERNSAQLQETLTWLSIEDRLQDDDFDSLCQRRASGTCNWIFKNHKFKMWTNDKTKNALLWIWGIPGSGKTMLCAHLVSKLRSDKNKTTLYYFCGSPANSHTDCSRIFRSLITQLIRYEPALSIHVCTEYVRRGISASLAHLREVLSDLLRAVPPAQIIIDGLDECDVNSHAQIIAELLTLSNPSTELAKVLISSREGGIIGGKLRKKPNLSLREESEFIENDINTFIKAKLRQSRTEWDFNVSEKCLAEVEQELLRLSNGMFLWVQLVIVTLQYQYTEDDLLSALNRLPRNLEEAYDRIFGHIFDFVPDKLTAEKLHYIFEHLAYSERPFHDFEILSAIGTYFGNTHSAQARTTGAGILDLCKPIVEVSVSSVVDFVHFSAKEYLRDTAAKHHIDACHGHESILKSCLSYILSTRIFLEQNASHSLMLEIAKSSHGIHRYVWKYWIIHLNEYIQFRHSASAPVSDNVLNKLQSLLWLHKTYPSDASRAMDDLHPSVFAFRGTPDVAALLSKIFFFQDSVRAVEQEIHDPNEISTELAVRDPTWLSEIHQKYEKYVDLLLRSSDPALVGDLEPQQLQDFRNSFGGRSYLCRYSTCASSTNGFRSQDTRDQHEATHVRKYKCDVLHCFMSDQGFKKHRDLKLHCQKYHPLSKVPELVLDPPSVTQDTSSGDFYVEYAPDLERTFTVDLLYQFTSESVCTCVAISGDERYFAVGGNRKIYICSLGSGKEVMRFEVNDSGPVPPDCDDWVRGLLFTTDCKFLIGATDSGRIMTWEIGSKELKADIKAHRDTIYAAAISSDGNHVASVSADLTARVWDMCGNEVGNYVGDVGLADVKFFPDQHHLILACLDNTVKIVDWRTRSLVETLLGHADSCYGVDVLPISRKIFSASLDKTVKIWSREQTVKDTSPKTNLGYSDERTLTGHEDFALAVKGVEKAGWLISGSRDRSIRIWDIFNGKVLCSILKHKNSVIRLATSPSNPLLFASASGDFRACVWLIRKTNANTTRQNLSTGLASQTIGSSNPGETSNSSAAAPVTSCLDYSRIAQSSQQSGPAGVPISQAKAPVANPATSQPPMNPTAAFNMQSQGNQQQMPSNGVRSMSSKLMQIPLNDQEISQMDPLPFPPTIINRNSDFANLPDDIKTWRQLKEHVQLNERELPPGSLYKVLGLQSIQYQINVNMIQRRRQQNMF